MDLYPETGGGRNRINYLLVCRVLGRFAEIREDRCHELLACRLTRTMKKNQSENCDAIVFTKHKPDNIRKVLDCYKNVLIRGMKGVGKITNTIRAIKDHTNVYYIGNPVDFE